MNTNSNDMRTAHPFIIFHFELTDLRIEIGKDGEPWFCAKDICDILNLENQSKSTMNLDEDERDTITSSDGVGRKKDMIFISESGLYALIFQSRKPEAKRFRKWVTKEVLPAIRKMGYFGEVSPKERLTHLEKIDGLIEKLIHTKNILLFQERAQTLYYHCSAIGRPMPNLTLLFKDAEQMSLEGFGLDDLPLLKGNRH